MRVDGRLRSDRTNDVDLLRRVRDVVFAPDHVRDGVPHILHRRCEVVGRPPVGANEHDVLELVVRELDAAAHGVVPGRDTLVRHAEPDRAFILVGLALVDQAPRDLGAVLQPVELEGDVAVPVEPEPAQGILDLLSRLLHLAVRVRVLDPEPELPALVAREQPVEERSPDVPDVQEAGRARSHADANGHTVRLLACCSAPIVPEV